MSGVLIVGAGPTGLTMACELARRGLPFRLVDAAAGPVSESRALGLWSRTLEVFDQFNLADASIARGLQVDRLEMWSGAGRLGEIRCDRLDSRYPFVLILPQGATQRLLIDRLAELGSEPEWGCRLTDLRPAASGARATLAAADRREETGEWDWVIGCDGAHSRVRGALGIPFDGVSGAEAFLLVDAVADTPFAPDRVRYYLSGAGVMHMVPLEAGGGGSGRYRLTFSLPDGGAPEVHDGAAVQRFVDERGPGGIRVRAIEWSSVFRIEQRLARAYRRGSCFLAGDAAHVQSPVGGQGINAGVQDAHNLAWKLAGVAQGALAPDVLNSYESERAPVGRQIVRGTRALTGAGMTRSRAKAAVRDAAIRALARTRAFETQVPRKLAGLEITYSRRRRVPMLGARRAVPGEGQRAPQERGDVVRMLLRDGRHVALVFEGVDASQPAPALAPLAARLRDAYADRLVVCVVQALDRATHGDYRARRGDAVVIRPDGYIARRVSAEQLADELEHLLGQQPAGTQARAETEREVRHEPATRG